MVFSSLTFLFYFLPAFLLLYFLVSKKTKNMVIFLGSLIFYYYGVKDQPAYVLLMLLSILVNYKAARKIEKQTEQRGRKIWLFTGLTYNMGCLFVFKYLDFVCANINTALGWAGAGTRLPYAELVLPIGISFYTFQITSYLIDVYWGEIPAEPSILTLGTYLCMFPQLIAGPIVTYSQVQEQLRDRNQSLSNLEEGLREFTIGLGLKVLIANQMGALWGQVGTIGYESISTPLAWLGLVAFSLQIYFDFYGYSLMAKGLGMIMGFRFPDNFRDPYLSKSMTEFWRRWHMTLGSWFREYVYIPLGGNRSHLYRNLLIVWMLTGLWHGASWNYVLWGLFICLLICVEKLGVKKLLERVPLLGHLYMLFVIPLSWMLFAITDLGKLGVYVGRLFPFLAGSGSAAVFPGDFVKYGRMYLFSLLAALICCTGLPRKLYEKRKASLLTALTLVAVFWACAYCMYMGLDDPFLYYQF